MGKAILTPIDNPEKVVKASKCMMSDGQTSVGDILTRKTLSESVTINANSSTTIEITKVNALAIAGIYPSINYTEICGFRVSGTSIFINLRNPSSSAITPTVYVDYL